MNRRGLPTLWLLSTALGWAVVPIYLLDRPLHTYLDVARMLPAYLLLGLLLGAATGIAQGLVWKLQGQTAWHWLWSSVLGYGLALPGGLAIGVLIPSMGWGVRTGNFLFMPLTQPGSVFYDAFPLNLIFGGFLVGLCQWPALRPRLSRSRISMALLWVFGVWLGIALGLFVGLIVAPFAYGWNVLRSLHGVVQAAAWGATVGLVSGAVLWILQREAGKGLAVRSVDLHVCDDGAAKFG